MDYTYNLNENTRKKPWIKLALIALIPISYIIGGAINWSSCSNAYRRIIFANTFAIIWSIVAMMKKRNPMCYLMIELQLLTVMWAVQCMNYREEEEGALEPHGNVYLMTSYVLLTLILWVHTFMMGLLGLIYGSLYLYYLANPHLIRRPIQGLNDEEIENLPIRKYDDQELSDPASPQLAKECVICLEHFKPNEDVTELPSCTHSFHKGCIVEWVKKQPHCPYCRNNIRESLTNSPTTIPATPLNLDSPINFNNRVESNRQVRISSVISPSNQHRVRENAMQLPAYAELQEV